MVRKISVEIEGLCPLLHHRMSDKKQEIDRMKELIKILQKDPDNEEAYKEEASIHLYKNKEGENIIPSVHIESAMIKAGVQERVAGRGKKTYKDHMKAFIVIEPEDIPITPQSYEEDRRFVRVQRAKVMRTRPKFPSGWKAQFAILVLDDTIPLKVIENILKFAGAYVGIGDWRPKFGRFEVTQFELQK